MKTKKKLVAIAIPIYRNFTEDEKISLKHWQKYLKNYDTYFVLPSTLNKKKVSFKGIKYKEFNPEFFKSIVRYNEFMSTPDFYEAFKEYEYILIYQLDAVVFKDELKKWCQKGFDYIGAPFFYPTIGFISHQWKTPYKVGNGGLCLRKVDSFLRVIKTVNSLTRRQTSSHLIRQIWFAQAMMTGSVKKKWLQAPASNYPFAEDGFWSFEAPKYDESFTIAPLEEALKFAFERYPRKCFKMNNHKLPFGVHAWKKHDQEFWMPYLLK